MQTVLDLDLDYFVWPIEYWPEGSNRLAEAEHRVSTEGEVRAFLESQCSLKGNCSIPGRKMAEHSDSFFTWRRWMDSGELSAPFNVVHVDAHADLGLGDGGWVYLLTDLLALPVSERREPRFGSGGLNSGNYLSFAIANRWVNTLTYVFPSPPDTAPSPEVDIRVYIGDRLANTIRAGGAPKKEQHPRPNDLLLMLFPNRDPSSGVIELRRYSKRDVLRIADNEYELPEPLHVEPGVPFRYIPGDIFKFDGFTHMTVAQSPQFTPPSADMLLPVIEQYFREV